MKIRRAAVAWAAVFVVVAASSASAQPAPPVQGVTTTIPDLTMANTMTQLVRPVGANRIGEALGLATQLEIVTAPFASAPGSFVFKLDPRTGNTVLTAPTFGPSYTERAVTAGEGRITGGVTFMSASYDRLDDQKFDGIQLSSVTATSVNETLVGVANVKPSSKTVVFTGRMGVTDRFDVGVDVPLISVKVDGSTALRNGSGETKVFATGSAVASGLGDIAALAKYRFARFGDKDQVIDPGGLAVLAKVSLPTGDTDNLRGLGVTRTLLSFIVSGSPGRFQPHASVGFEWWNKGIAIASDAPGLSSVSARHQIQYAAGVEIEAAPKLTVLVDFLGREIRGAGRIGIVQQTQSGAGIVSTESAVALPEGLRKIDLAPGAKVNVKGKILISINALIALYDTGLHSRVTPAAGIGLSF